MKKIKDYGLVSIIMPSYNTEKYIEKSIKSVQNQTYINWELIIVDDCSKDKSAEIIKKMQSDKRIKYFKNTKNSGAALSRNKALREAKGKWIAFLDSDDLWHKEKLEKQLKFMVDNNYNFTYCNYEEIDENDKKNGIYVTGPKKISKIGMYSYCWPGCLTVMYNKNVVGLIQIEDIKKNNDYAIWLKISKKTNCYLLDEKLAKYRKRSGSISNNNYLKLIKWHYNLFRYADHKNILVSYLLTFNNLIWGVLKKIIYVRKEV